MDRKRWAKLDRWQPARTVTASARCCCNAISLRPGPVIRPRAAVLAGKAAASQPGPRPDPVFAEKAKRALCLRIADSLPLEVRDGIRTATGERPDVVRRRVSRVSA